MAGAVTTLYWRDPSGKVLMETDGSGNALEQYVYLNDMLVTRGHLSPWPCLPWCDYYYIHDHLGTTRMITDSVGTICYDADYFPYGTEQRIFTNNCAFSQNNYKFTGKERDPDLAIDDFGAR